MLDINAWMEDFQRALAQTFPGRLWFVGLQGSRARGEAHEGSDIDVVVVLDEVSLCDLAQYRACWTSCRTAPGVRLCGRGTRAALLGRSRAFAVLF